MVRFRVRIPDTTLISELKSIPALQSVGEVKMYFD